MPVQHAVVWADSDAPRLVRVDDVPDTLNHPKMDGTLGSVLSLWRERVCSPEETEAWRVAGMEETVKNHQCPNVAATRPAVPEPIVLTPRRPAYGKSPTTAKPGRKSSVATDTQMTVVKPTFPLSQPEPIVLTSQSSKDVGMEQTTGVTAPPSVTARRKKSPVLSAEELTKPLPNAYEVAEDGSLG